MRVIASIRALQAARRMSNESLRQRVGITRSRWYDRMNDGHFTIGEVMAIADVFGVSVQSLVDGQVTVEKFRRELSSIKGEGKSSRPWTPLVRAVS